MDIQAAKLWSTTELVIWPDPFVVIDFPAAAFPRVSEWLTQISDPFVALVFEPDQVSVTVTRQCWMHASVHDLVRNVGETFRLITLKQDVGLEVSGFLAPPIQRIADAKIPIIPHGSYLKEHWLFLEQDAARAEEILRTYIDEQTAIVRTAT